MFFPSKDKLGRDREISLLPSSRKYLLFLIFFDPNLTSELQFRNYGYFLQGRENKVASILNDLGAF